MISVNDLMVKKVQLKGNTYFIVDGKLIAIVFEKAAVSVKVNLEVVYDEKWETVVVDHDGPLAIVFSTPPSIKSTVDKWLAELGMFDIFWIAGAFNGLCFWADYVPTMLRDMPRFENGQSSDTEMNGEINDNHRLARELIETMFGVPWDQTLVSRTQEAQVVDFITIQSQ